MVHQQHIINLIHEYENPKRIAISRRYPVLKTPLLFLRRSFRKIKNFFDVRVRYKRALEYYECIVVRHQSVLRRTLGDSNPRLQEQKIINLQQAVNRLNGVTIPPHCIFSLWEIIGAPTYKNGYGNGMLLSNGKIVEGVGGGLCQMSNLLYWMFLHAPFKTIERFHHSLDVFPDSGRILPFGGGATIMYNFLDLKVQNISPFPLQLKLWITENHLKGQILSPQPLPQKFHVFEKDHYFIKRGEQYFRYNEIYKETKINGEIQKIEKITTNFAPVLYPVNQEYLEKNNFTVLDFTNTEEAQEPCIPSNLESGFSRKQY
ncbi:MAG: VanW family protein [Candidatus Peregrinibacteria bacterium]